MFKTTTFVRSSNDFKLSGIVDVLEKDNLTKFFIVFFLISFFLYTKLIYLLTRFWPFSLFWRKKYFHYDNRFISKASNMIEETLKKVHKPFYVVGAGGDGHFYMILGRFIEKNKSFVNKKTEVLIKDLFGLSYGQVFVRTGKYRFREILLDRESLEKTLD